MKLSVLISFLYLQSVLACQWVCIDKNNNIKQHYFDKTKVRVEYPLVPAIDVQEARAKRIWKQYFFRPKVTLRMPSFEVEPLEVSCQSKEFSKTIMDMTSKTRCDPRDTIVDIVYEGGKVVPNKVSTKLCKGICSNTKSCLSIERVNFSLPVRTVLDNGEVQCSTVSIPEDIKCKCVCNIKQSDCLPTQIFEKNFCTCKCINEEEYLDCLYKIKTSNQKTYTWNKNTCSCQCIHEKTCTTGTIWDRGECKCVKI